LIHHIHCFRHPFQISKKNNPSFGINPSFVSYDKDEFQKGKDNIKEKSLEPSQDPSKYGHISHTRAREIQCFKCLGEGHLASQYPNEKTMILRDKDEYSSHEEETSESEENEKKKKEIENQEKALREKAEA